MSAIQTVPIHGGLDAPVNRVVPLGKRNDFLKEAAELPFAVVTNADLSTVFRIADGTLSPLEGPMGKDEWHQVLDEERIVRGGVSYAWTIPLSFPISDEEAVSISAGKSVAIRDEAGNAVAIIENVEIFDYDKAKYVKSVYGTKRMDHPGGRMTASDPRTKLLGGKLRALAQPINLDYGEYMLSPLQSRALFATRQYERVLAFQTRNPLHRAHEYALVSGAEDLTKAGHFTGVVLNPLMGELKSYDVPARIRMRTSITLHDRRHPGKRNPD